MTMQPLALRIWTVNSPINPRPMTTTVSPSVGAACRTPCNAMAPKVTKLASSSSTPLGTATVRFFGTALNSA